MEVDVELGGAEDEVAGFNYPYSTVKGTGQMYYGHVMGKNFPTGTAYPDEGFNIREPALRIEG